MNTDKLEAKLMALVVSCRTMESQEEIGNQIMQYADDIVKNCSIPAAVWRSEQLRAFARWYEENYQFEISDRAIQEYERYGS